MCVEIKYTSLQYNHKRNLDWRRERQQDTSIMARTQISKKVHAILSRHITYFVLDIHVLDLYLPNMHGKQVDGELA